MATVDSTSTTAEVVAALEDNASWEEDDSVAKAKAYVTAAKIYLIRAGKRSKHGDNEFEIDPASVRAEMDNARRFVGARTSSGAGSVRYVDLSGVRD